MFLFYEGWACLGTRCFWGKSSYVRVRDQPAGSAFQPLLEAPLLGAMKSLLVTAWEMPFTILFTTVQVGHCNEERQDVFTPCKSLQRSFIITTQKWTNQRLNKECQMKGKERRRGGIERKEGRGWNFLYLHPGFRFRPFSLQSHQVLCLPLPRQMNGGMYLEGPRPASFYTFQGSSTHCSASGHYSLAEKRGRSLRKAKV